MKSAIYCGHANESPQYERLRDKLICACPEDCYCKHDGGCKNLRRSIALDPAGRPKLGELILYSESRIVAACTSAEALEAARRLMSL